MDPSLKREKEAFKKKLIAAADKSQRSREEAAKAKASVQAAPPAKKAKKKHSHTVNNAGEMIDDVIPATILFILTCRNSGSYQIGSSNCT